MPKNFDFGENWLRFSNRYLNDQGIEKSKECFLLFCGGNPLEGKTFIDVGCGSGLHSLTAHRLGASTVMSFDINEKAVECCRALWKREGSPSNWEISAGSVLEDSLISKFGTYDFVYSWGVLHHTGAMWKSIENTSRLVAEGGQFYLAIYNKAEKWRVYPEGRFGPSRFWAVEKKIYAGLPVIFQNIVDYLVMTILVLLYLLTLKNPVKKIREHRNLRGMSWRVDIKDWLGGYPYEYASFQEVTEFMNKLGFDCEKVKSNEGLLNNEFLFRKREDFS